MAEWKINTDVVLQLLDAYKKFECLWNFKSDDYKQPGMRQNAWLRLGEMFDTTPDMVKRKIKYLRSAYVSEKKKVEASMTSGDPNVVYRPRLFYFRKFRFLDSVIFLRGNKPVEQSIYWNEDAAQDESDSPRNFEHVSVQSTSNSTKSMKRKLDIELKFEDETLDERTSFEIDDENGTIAARFAQKKTKSEENSSEYEIPVKKPSSQDSLTDTDGVDNLYTQFGRTVALQLSQLSPLEATSAMSTMHRYLSKKIVHALLRAKREQSLRRDSRPDSVEVMSTLGESCDEYL